MRLQRIIKRLDIDRAVFFGLIAKVWSMCSGPVTALLITTNFSPEVQGYYYTFATLLALQVFIQLGLGTVIIQFASHEWAKLELTTEGKISGDKDSLSRLLSISQIAFKWYFIAGILVILGVGFGGYFFFINSTQSSLKLEIDWVLPWFVLCLIEGISIWLVPVWSVLEGCNQVSHLYTFRFFQGFFTSITIWICMILGAELWTAAFSAAVYVITSIFFLGVKYWNFIKALFLSKPTGPQINWRKDLLPMQWRIAISWMSGYFIFSLFVPVLFKYHGALLAGQMGMTWSLIVVLGSVSSSWLSPKAPVFGMLIAQQNYDELNSQFWRTTKIIMVVSTTMAVTILSAVIFINYTNIPILHKFASRLLSPLPTALFLLAQLLYVISSPFATYLRAHKREPLMMYSVIYAGLMAISTLLLGRFFSVLGMSIGYVIVNIILLPFMFSIWKRCRKEWHIV